MRHALAHWLHSVGNRLDHIPTHDGVSTVHAEVWNHDGMRTITINDHGTRLRATYEPVQP